MVQIRFQMGPRIYERQASIRSKTHNDGLQRTTNSGQRVYCVYCK